MKQLRVPLDDLKQIVLRAIREEETFETLSQKYPVFEFNETIENEEKTD
jgi:hypothetical protein